VGAAGFVFMVLGAWAERFLGKRVNAKPGDDMLHAIRQAAKSNIPVALIDQDIRITLKRIALVPWKERLRFLADLLRPKKISFNLSEVPAQDIVDRLIMDMSARYPTAHRILVSERNQVMAQHLARLSRGNVLVVAIIGAGHVRDIAALLNNYLSSENKTAPDGLGEPQGQAVASFSTDKIGDSRSRTYSTGSGIGSRKRKAHASVDNSASHSPRDAKSSRDIV
jgi:pheromone shutdown protein TraB